MKPYCGRSKIINVFEVRNDFLYDAKHEKIEEPKSYIIHVTLPPPLISKRTLKSPPRLALKQNGFPYSGCGPFTKNKEEIQSLFTRLILIKLVFNMIWLMTNIKI